MKWSGIVTKGKGDARHLGTPTANIYIPASEYIKEGLYSGLMYTDTTRYPSVIYITLESDSVYKIESHAIGYTDLNLYDTMITVHTITHIRECIQFPNIDALKEQIQTDLLMCKESTSAYLRVLNSISHFKKGNPVIIMDDLERENEGDLVYPAESIVPQDITDTLQVSSGIVCVTLTEEKAHSLHIPVMYHTNEDPNKTNFTVSVDHISTTTGVSAFDRAKTIREIVSSTTPNDFTRPGHIFPLIAKNGLLKERQGHTEASVQLCLLSELKPVGVICELMNRDGSMMRLKDCEKLSREHSVPLISVKDIIYYSDCIEFSSPLTAPLLEWSECNLTIEHYEQPFIFRVAKNRITKEEMGILCTPSFHPENNPLIRVHSECLTGNVFHSRLCDCYDQFHNAIKSIYSSGNGCIMYVTNHEGRGIGLLEKIKAYKLQSQGEDTVSANLKLGWKEDQRDYSFCIRVLQELSVKEFQLLTNNPEKVRVFGEQFKITPIHFKSKNHSLNVRYLSTKVEKMNHSRELLSTVDHGTTRFLIDKERVRGKQVCIINTVWNKEYVEAATTKIINVCKEYEVNVDVVTVPGAFELPIKCKQLSVSHNKYDCIIAVGVVLKGETMHFEYICESVYKGLMDVQLSTGVPIINGVLTCLTKKHIEDRIYSSLPEDWGLSALNML